MQHPTFFLVLNLALTADSSRLHSLWAQPLFLSDKAFSSTTQYSLSFHLVRYCLIVSTIFIVASCKNYFVSRHWNDIDWRELHSLNSCGAAKFLLFPARFHKIHGTIDCWCPFYIHWHHFSVDISEKVVLSYSIMPHKLRDTVKNLQFLHENN